ncbi:heterokaryon incompatibility protein-domain-containing protein [Truncatella angustata]|uniref:Heterokaryon incompatibility protein-domain-containing protein n=1 Tax=Truncatella angustata TaxID=152316 RepID=A0A9P8UXY1_9PEZI|nr:heterokaryon incompatibility protein-domain-containing protein [Truncatella angustata]KAH6660581.1 heterokaryon incompatibility protein-domain-containing protein [Truncatella angustata]
MRSATQLSPSNPSIPDMGERLIERLQDALGSLVEAAFPTNSNARTPSFSNPHTCRHCCNITVQAKTLEGAESWLRSNAVESGGLLALDHDFDGALKATRDGCGLYRWLLDQLLRGTKSNPDVMAGLLQSNHIRFSLVFSKDEPIYSREVRMRCDPLIESNKGNMAESPWEILLSDAQGIDVCAREGDPGASFVSFRAPQEDIFSSSSIRFARDCMNTCINFHELCRDDWIRRDRSSSAYSVEYAIGEQLPSESLAIDALPTRLLETEERDGLVVRLIELADLSAANKSQIAADGFATLSYCWGQGNPVQLTANSYETLRRGIEISALPATIEQSIRFVFLLGLKYIWVDALCIFQDDITDKEIEISRMGSYYSANTLTVCAASPSGAAVGFLDPESKAVCQYGPINLSCNIDGMMGNLLLHSDPSMKEPVAERGWTLQESLLSRRILIFSHQLYWCCSTANAGCEGSLSVLPRDTNRNMGWPHSLVPGIFPMSVLRVYPPEYQWFTGLSSFTERRLGFEADKLLAISALAERIHLIFQARGQSSIESRSYREFLADLAYVAGIFLSRSHKELVASQLLWTSTTASKTKRVETYRAPSWSWACVDGSLQSCLTDAVQEAGRFSVLDWDVTLTNNVAPYGSVRYAAIHMRCHLRSLPFNDTNLPVKVIDWIEEPLQAGIRIMPDTAADRDCILSTDRENQALRLLQLTDVYSRTPFSGIRGLVVILVAELLPATYKRVGTFTALQEQKSAKAGDQGLSSFFDVPEQDVVLI